MTTRALIFSPEGGHFDHSKTKESLRIRAIRSKFSKANVDYVIAVEPLIKKGSDGKLLQTVRIRALDGSNVLDALGEPAILDANGNPISTGGESAPYGSWRTFIPEVTSNQNVTITFSKASEIKVNVEVNPQRHWKIHLVHHTHLDIGYTDPQGTVLAEHLAFLDSALDIIKATDNWPEESKFRWTVEALWSFDEWTKVRPKEKIEEFIRRVKEGRLELTAMPYNLHTETCSTDELHELLRLAGRVKQKYGLEIPSAMQTDVPGAVVGMTDALSENGVKYLSVAHNWAGRSVPHLVGGQNQPRLFKWVGPSGKGVLVWVTDTPHGLAYMEGPMLGFHEDYDSVDDLLPAYLQSHAEHPYPYPGGVFGWAVDKAEITRKPYPWDILHMRIQGQFADNAPPRLIMSETIKRWNETWEYPKLRLSTNRDFFEEAETRLSGQIQTIEGDWTDWWVEGVGSGARPNAMVRNAQAVVANAQSVAAFATAFGSKEGPAIRKSSEDVYSNASLFDEHTWGAANPWTIGDAGMDSGDQQWHWKYSKALAATDEGDVLLDRSSAHLGELFATANDALASFYVSNTSLWDRTDEVVAFLPESRVPLETNIKVVDSRTGKTLDFFETPQVNPKHRNAGRYLHFVLPEIKGTGIVRIDVQKGDKNKPLESSIKNELVLENDFYIVTIDTKKASIGSIFSKKLKRELVNQNSVVGFNSYIYDEYASQGGWNHQSGRMEGNIRLDLLATRSLTRPAVVLERGSNALGEWIVIESQAPGSSWVRTKVSLLQGVDRVDIENRIYKEARLTKESGYFAFPFAFDNPITRIEITGGMTGTDLPLVPGSALHMRAARRWVSYEDENCVAALAIIDAPLIQLGGIALPYAPFPQTMGDPEPATVYSWIHNNIWDTNFPPQQGFEMNFKYSVGASQVIKKGDSGPALGARVAGGKSRSLVATLGSNNSGELIENFHLIECEDSRVRLVGMSTQDDGRILFRLQSFANSEIKVKIKFDKKLSAPILSTFLGISKEKLEVVKGTVEVPINRLGVVGVMFEVQ
jgi:hypothetical protein